ncbi:MAG: hypothetical protein AB1801_25485, partial [Chloroflexota bacterium]
AHNAGHDSRVERFTLTGHTAPVLDCIISPTGDLIVSASDDHTLKVWDAHTGTERFTLAGHRLSVWDCAINSAETVIVSASADSTLKIWNIAGHNDIAPSKRRTERLTLQGHTDTVYGCAMSPDESFLVSASSDHTLKVWDVQTGLCLITLYVDGPLFDCAWSPDGQHIVAVGSGGVYFLRLVR